MITYRGYIIRESELGDGTESVVTHTIWHQGAMVDYGFDTADEAKSQIDQWVDHAA